MVLKKRLRYIHNGSALIRPGKPDIPLSLNIQAPAKFTTVVEDQYASNSGNWSVYNNSVFGNDAANTRIQRYMTANAQFGAGSAGATNGTSLRLITKREAVGGNEFTAGMVDSQSASKWYPRYGFYQFRTKTPHGHGLWPAWWMTAKNGGAGMCEWDVQEYFHGQIPGKNSSTLHGKDNSGVFATSRYTNNTNRTFFEAPTYTPQWHVWATEIVPVTDSTGNTLADPTQPSSNVRFRVLLDGVEVYRFVDTSALYWTTNGGTADSFWNIYIQGCQVSGKYVGHPDIQLAYSAQLGACLIAGTPPDACTISRGGYSVQRAGAPGALATLNNPATTYEIDYFYCAKFTG